MSRSNPNDNSPNPATRWHNWNGGSGIVEYYDKEAKETVEVGDKFTFILLDQLSVVKGWHDTSDSGITSNEVKDTKAETMVVKAFKGGILAEGLYANIRDRIKAVGGHFTSNLYIVYRDENKKAQLGCIQFKGAALNAWVDFCKAHRLQIWRQAISIVGATEAKKGKITYHVPKFALKELSDETNKDATRIDAEILQPYLKSYFARTRTQQIEAPAAAAPVPGESEPPLAEPDTDHGSTASQPDPIEDDCPF